MARGMTNAKRGAFPRRGVTGVETTVAPHVIVTLECGHTLTGRGTLRVPGKLRCAKCPRIKGGD
jgi:hypothetical protein